MKLYPELETTIEEIVENTDEEAAFKKRLKKLIYNYFERSYGQKDLEDTIELLKLKDEDGDNEWKYELSVGNMKIFVRWGIQKLI